MSTAPKLGQAQAYRLKAMLPVASILVLAMLGASPLHAATHPRLVITASPGFTIAWDGNNGGFAGLAPSNNVALASNGTVAFSSSDLGPELGIPFHVANNLNDGLYGNANSWISGSAPDPFAALRFASSANISNVAWGRANVFTGDPCAGGVCTDRSVGTYTLQVTQVANPDGTTPDTGDAATGWATIGTVEYLPGLNDANFSSHLRHRFDVTEGGNAIAATGLRIKVSIGGLGGGLAIDEIEVNPITEAVPPVSSFLEITPAAGFGIAWDGNDGNFSTPNNPAPVPANDASTSRGATPFTSTDLGPALGIPFHRAVNLNDGLYGNANSWIPNFIAGDPAPFAGINLGRRRLVSSIAWGRDNGNAVADACDGTCTDRALGVYVLQITTVPNPGPVTPEACSPSPDSGWVTIGTINFKANNPSLFNSHLRHRFDVTQGGAPIAATGIRIKAPNANSAIDEIEVNANVAIENGALRITSAPDASLIWDGNDGQFNNPAVDAAPPANRALASAGTTPFTSSDLGPSLGIPFHVAANLNDGLYGNANSWISANGIGGTSDPDPFAGLIFGGAVSITNIAWGRDNGNVAGDCCGGTLTDRALDTYRLQYTSVPAPDATTPDTGDAATGWQDLGTVTYASAAPPFFTPSLRHRFDVAAGGLPVDATGIRIKVASGNTAIDEIEINAPAGAPPPPSPVGITPAAGYGIAWDGNDGQYQNPAAGAQPPANRALASQGSSAFSSSDLGPLLGIPFHVAANINDGLYGNAKSWISANGIGGASDPDPSVGVNFNGMVDIRSIAWSRDNGDAGEGIFTDRALGTYTIQVTTASAPGAATPETGDPATGWATIGTIEYRQAEPGEFTPHLRHRFDISSGGQPVAATGVRVKVSNGQMDIDELEVNTATTPPPCCNAEPGFTLAGNSTTSDENSGPVAVPGWLSNVSAGANEPNQMVTVHISNDNPGLFSAQPAFDAAGALTYTPVSGASGSANVTVYVTDDGGTGVCGDDTSATATFAIVIRAVNDCPVASVASITLLQDGQASFQLTGADADGDPLQYEVTQPPVHGFLTVQLQTGAASYSPNRGYCGPDSFRYRVFDGQCRSEEVTVAITVTCVALPPTAIISSGQLIDLKPEYENPVLLSCNWWNACLVADGWTSSDPENGDLTYLWSLGNDPVPFGAGPVVTNCLEVGTHTIILTVTDPTGLQDTDTKTIEVVTAPLAIELLIERVNESHKNGVILTRKIKRELTETLRVALRFAGEEKLRETQKALDAFEKKVRAQVAPTEPEAATAWIRWSQAVSDGMEKCIKPPRKSKDRHDDEKDDGDDKK